MELLNRAREEKEKLKKAIEEVEAKILKIKEKIENDTTEDIFERSKKRLQYQKEIEELNAVKNEIIQNTKLVTEEVESALIEELGSSIKDTHAVRVEHKTKLTEVIERFLTEVEKIDNKYNEIFKNTMDGNYDLLDSYEEFVNIPRNLSVQVTSGTPYLKTFTDDVDLGKALKRYIGK
ncbi:MAG: hypothetical protein Q3988_01055 [Gemella sp.]|nr:hypothetical protein [Gemella sp.]